MQCKRCDVLLEAHIYGICLACLEQLVKKELARIKAAHKLYEQTTQELTAKQQ